MVCSDVYADSFLIPLFLPLFFPLFLPPSQSLCESESAIFCVSHKQVRQRYILQGLNNRQPEELLCVYADGSSSFDICLYKPLRPSSGLRACLLL